MQAELHAHRVTWGPLQNPIRGLLHGSAALVALLLAVQLVSLGECEGSRRVALLAFALSQFGLYAASALYHSAPWKPRWKRRMQRVDHAMIYVKIAGTMTPIVWIGLEDERRWILLGATWCVAILGVAQKALLPAVNPRACIPVQIAQATLVLPAVGPFAERFPGTPLLLVLLGMALYGLGALVFLIERPKLWPRVFSFHELFHVLLVTASGLHAALVLQYLAAAH